LSAIKDLFNILKKGENFLIDRGDLSKEIKIENIPSTQRKILKLASKLKKKCS
jgi:pyruvate kinase